ncbi:lipopolysaccharide assembly protein LapA domain-containing protein [Planctobacterium marinum]|uniref:lipopolysaccharide assembly protein LapA domain-containing protein n=1 Tax=Planctobacterium marinum TaxID=1631968 RepID=UPI001E4B87C8|nr:LapA family protein [Planctobacterium marinum]MCC2604143.1 LapA family protein [Planctobacterium marinum]
MKAFLYISICLLGLILAIVLGSQNTQLTDFNFLIARQTVSVTALMSGSILFGACLASLFWIIYVLKLKLKLRSQNKKFVKSLDKTN